MLRTTLLLGALTGVIMAMGNYMGGSSGMTIAFIIAVVMNFGAYWFSDKMVLRAYSAREVTEAEAPQLYRIVHNLTLAAKMPMPKVYIIPSESPNAFATGRNPSHAAVAVTEALLELLVADSGEAVAQQIDGAEQQLFDSGAYLEPPTRRG